MKSPAVQRVSRAVVFAATAAAVELLPPLTLQAAGRGLILVGNGLKTLGEGLEQLGEQTLRYAQKQRRYNSSVLRDLEDAPAAATT